jgi:hypothetical protein
MHVQSYMYTIVYDIPSCLIRVHLVPRYCTIILPWYYLYSTRVVNFYTLYKFCVSIFNFHATTCHDYDLAFPVVLVPVLPVAGFESGGVNVG